MKGKHCEQDHDYDKPLLLVRAGSLDPLQRQRTGISLDPGAVVEDGDGLLGLDHDIDAWSEQPESAGTTDDDARRPRRRDDTGDSRTEVHRTTVDHHRDVPPCEHRPGGVGHQVDEAVRDAVGAGEDDDVGAHASIILALLTPP